MRFFDFKCKKCEHQYEARTAYDPKGKFKGVKCPECNSSSKEHLITGCSFNFSNPIGTDRWTSDGNGHQYRYDFNAPYVAKQREFAEKTSHMGTQPYEEIDDITSGQNFGEVK